jgi:hypothetical protein
LGFAWHGRAKLAQVKADCRKFPDPTVKEPFRRHCERSEAIHKQQESQSGLPRFARNDGKIYAHLLAARRAPSCAENLALLDLSNCVEVDARDLNRRCAALCAD